MKLLSILSFILLFPFMSLAQGEMEDVVYLKNGSIIRGVIIEQVPGVSIKIQTADRNVFVFRIEEVEKMTKEPAPPKARQRPVRGEDPRAFTDADIKQRGYSAMADVVFSVGYNDFVDKSSFGMQMINGYQFSPNFTAGIGLGINQHFNGAAYMPAFLDLRANFLRRKVTPFLNVAGGWALGLVDEKDEGGAFVNPSVGVKFFVSRNTALQLAVGFRYQQGVVTHDYYDWYGNVNRREYVHHELNSATLKFGVAF